MDFLVAHYTVDIACLFFLLLHFFYFLLIPHLQPINHPDVNGDGWILLKDPHPIERRSVRQ